MNYKQTIVLAALIGLMPACKDQINEPEKTAKQSGMSTSIYGASADETPVDAFMKHVPNVENVKFYIPREETSYLSFEVNSASGDIYKMTEERDVKQTSTNIIYPLVFNRTDNMSTDGTASFTSSETTWNYTVSYTTQNNETRTWSIEDIPASELNVYANLSREAMAYLARDTILSRNPNEKAHADSVYMNIKYGHSAEVTQNEPTTIQFSSMGAQQHLEHSDFGTITYTKGATSETKVYLGVNMEDGTHVLNCPATSINITAYANVQRTGANADGQQLVLTTGKNAGKYTIDINHNETIVMPFRNWYTVTLIRTPSKLRSYLTDPTNVVPAKWQFIHTDKVEDAYIEKVNNNGSWYMEGSWDTGAYIDGSSNGIRTNVAFYNFLDSDGKLEVISNGYREDYDASGDRIVMSFCFGGTDRYNEDPELTTGLEMIYCAPQR